MGTSNGDTQFLNLEEIRAGVAKERARSDARFRRRMFVAALAFAITSIILSLALVALNGRGHP